MATAGELIFKVVVDGKEANAAIQLTDKNIEHLAQQIKKYQNETQTLPSAQNQVVKGNQAMTQSLGQLGWVLGDANMFAVNFRMGMMAIGNNIPMVVQGLIQARQQAAELGQTFTKSLVTSLMGPGGVMLGINALMLALQVLPGLFGEVETSVEQTAGKIKALASEAEGMSRQTLMQRIAIEEIALESFNAQKAREIEANKVIKKDKEGNEYVSAGTPSSATLTAISQTTEAINAYKSALANLGIEQNRQNQLSEFRNRYLKAQTESERLYYKNLIDNLEAADKIKRKKKQADLEYSYVNTSELVLWWWQNEVRLLGAEQQALQPRTSAQMANILYLNSRQFPNKMTKVAVPERNGVEGNTVALENQLIVVNQLESAYMQMGNAAMSALSGVIRPFKEAKNLGEQIANILADMATKMIALTLFNSIFSMIKMPLGLPFFADGGVVTRPTLGVIGEAGPEAIVPLSRFNAPPSIITLNITGEFRQSGTDLVAVVRRVQKLERLLK